MDHIVHGNYYSQVNNPYGGVVSIETSGVGPDTLPQWSVEETREFLIIRAGLDPDFMETKRNKLLWEMVSTRLREVGYNRSPDQCKCKWKNLVTRYKGCETMEIEGMRQNNFPYYNEMQIIFTARMQRMLWLEAESSKKKAVAPQFSSDEEDGNDDVGEIEKGNAKKKRKLKGTVQQSTGGSSGINNNSIVDGLREIMEEFMRQRMEIEMQWVRAYEEREEKRRVKEMEWRRKMEALENERILMEKRWREKEEERRISYEARAEKREALITALLNKLRREGM